MSLPRQPDLTSAIEVEDAPSHALVGLVVGCLLIGCSWKFDFDLPRILASLFPNLSLSFFLFLFSEDLVGSGCLLLLLFDQKKGVAKFIPVACLSVLYFPFCLIPPNPAADLTCFFCYERVSSSG